MVPSPSISECIEIPAVSMNPSELIAIVAMCFAFLGAVLTMVTAGIFIAKYDTPIVRASSKYCYSKVLFSHLETLYTSISTLFSAGVMELAHWLTETWCHAQEHTKIACSFSQYGLSSLGFHFCTLTGPAF